MNSLLVVPISLALVLSGILFKGVDVVYLAIVLMGIWFFLSEKNTLSDDLKVFYTLALVLLLAISIAVIRFDWHAFFSWRFSSFEPLLFIPFIAAYLMKYRCSDQTFWKILIVSALFTPVWVVMILWSWPVPRSTGLLSDAINRGNMGMLFGLISLIALFAVDEWRWKLLAFIGFGGGVILSVLSGSRGGWLALIVSLFTLTFIFFKFARKAEFRGLVSAQLVLLLAVILFWDYLPIQGRLMQVVNDIQLYADGNVHTSVGYRFELWKVSYYAFLEKPLLGWGWSNFNAAHEYVMQAGLADKTRLFGHPHNQFLLFLVETGVFGMLALLAFLLWPLLVSIRYVRKSVDFNPHIYWAVLMIVVTEAIVEFSLTDDSFSQKYFVFVYLLLSLVVLQFLRDKAIDSNTEISSKS
jgi:O-antigen ligase